MEAVEPVTKTQAMPFAIFDFWMIPATLPVMSIMSLRPWLLIFSLCVSIMPITSGHVN
jgi:hypothetical protein